MIKCPECGHQISDKAPLCPSCGVEIAGKVVKCPNCGEVYFKEAEMCPNCHRPTSNSVNSEYTANEQITENEEQTQNANEYSRQPAQVADTIEEKTNSSNSSNTDKKQVKEQPKKKGRTTLIISFVIALLICGFGFYFYKTSADNKEQQDYESAMNSQDPTVLQSYLDRYKDAPMAHIDSIQAHLNILKSNDQDWTNALVSNSKTALEDYLRNHPNSQHKAEALNKIDSLDWDQTLKTNTEEAFNEYLSQHPDGKFIDEAQDNLDKLQSTKVQPEEKQMISNLFRHFFQSINSKDEDALTSTVSNIMTSFLGKQGATQDDVINFMHKIYKDDIKNMNWIINSAYKIQKKEVGDQEYEYTVQFSAQQQIDRTDPTKEKLAKYKIKAKVSPDDKISEFNMIKIVE